MEFELAFCFAESQRRVAMENFVDEDSEGPDISFGAIYIIDEALG